LRKRRRGAVSDNERIFLASPLKNGAKGRKAHRRLGRGSKSPLITRQLLS